MPAATSSTVPAAKSKLVELLRGRAALNGVKVSYYWEGPGQKGEAIFLGGVIGRSVVPHIGTAVRRSRQESYTLEVRIYVASAGAKPSTADEVEARAFALLAELDSALAEKVHLDLGDSGFQSAILGDWTAEELEPLEKGWAARITASVVCEARLS